MKILEVKNIKFNYDQDHQVLNDLSFALEQGQYVCLIGPNGSGKSTIAKLILGLLSANSGEIVVDGLTVNPDNLAKIRNKIGIVFQNPDNQFIGATVEDDIAFGLENHLVPSEDMPNIIREFASEVGMENFLNSEPSKLSGGQKQRVAIAGVLATNPEIIIFDEATAMLDPKGKKEIIGLAKTLHRKKHKTILSITHDMEEVVNSDYVLVLDKGKIVLSGSPKEIFSQTKTLLDSQMDLPFVAKLSLMLRNEGVIKDMELFSRDLVEGLWQLNLKK